MKLKGDLDNLYQTWQEQINNRDVDRDDVFLSLCRKKLLEKKLSKQIFELWKAELKTVDKKVKQELKLLFEEVKQFHVQLIEKHQNFIDFVIAISNIEDDELRGLTPQRIHQFIKFTADESFVGDQCVICMGDIEIGRNMMRLDCDGQHTFCQVCIEGWFVEHKTCPICRHEF